MSAKEEINPSEITSPRDLDSGVFAIRAIQNDPTLLPSTKKQYIKAIERYLETGGRMTDPAALVNYASAVSNSTRSYLAAAVTRMA